MNSLTQINRRGSPGSSRFGTTLWSLVDAAKGEDIEARDQLFRRYWYPLYAYLRRKGQMPEQARDLVQGFLAHLLAKERLGDPDAGRSKFRTFLLSSLDHYTCNEWRRERETLKRGKGVEMMPLDGLDPEQAYSHEPKDLRDPASLYDRAWARMILKEAQARLRGEWLRAGKVETFDELAPALEGEKTKEGYEALAARRRLTVGGVKKAVYELRRNYRKRIRAVLGEECRSPNGQVTSADLEDLYQAMQQ